MWLIRRIHLLVWVTAAATLAGCLSTGSAARSPWQVQRVQPWPNGPMRQMAPPPAAPQTLSPRSGTAPPANEKLVPIPTPDPQSKADSSLPNGRTTRTLKPATTPEMAEQPQIRFKPAPLGTTADSGSDNVTTIAPRDNAVDNPKSPTRTKPSVPSLPTLGFDDKPANNPNVTPSPKGSRFEPLAAPSDLPLKLQITGQRQRALGGTVTFDVVVRNDSQRSFEDVVINVDFDRELVFPGHVEKQVKKNLGSLRPGQTREMRLTLASNKLGEHACRFEVTAEGLEPIKHTATVAYIEPKLRLQLIGPERRTLGSRAEFTVKVANTSDQPIDDLKVTLNHDAALSPREATGGYEREATSLRWTLGRLAPGEGVQVQAEFDCRHLAENACITAEARSDELSVEDVETCVTVVAVPGLLDLRISDRTDPITVGEEAEYEVTVQNLGLQAVGSVQIELQTSEHLRIETHEAKLGEKAISLTKTDRNGHLRLSLPESIPADGTLQLIIRAKALRPGDAELRVIATPGPDGTSAETSEFTTVNR